jgi:transcriptional regulator with XRE-family HTH domain
MQVVYNVNEREKILQKKDYFASNIALLKKIHGCTYRELEERSGINRSSIHEYIHNRTSVPLESAKILSSFFNITIDRLVYTDLKEESKQMGRK